MYGGFRSQRKRSLQEFGRIADEPARILARFGPENEVLHVAYVSPRRAGFEQKSIQRVEVIVGQALGRQRADRQTLARPFPVGGDDPTYQSKHVVSFNAAADSLHQNRMPDAREVGPDIHLGVPWKPTDVLMNPRRRGQRPLAGTAGVRVVDERPIENRTDPVHQRVMQHTLAKTGGEDRAPFRVVDLKSTTLTDSHRLIQNLGAECRDPGFEIIEEVANLGSMALTARGKEGRFRKVVALRDVVEINPYPFQWSSLDLVPRQRPGQVILQYLQKGRPVLLDRAAPTPGISSRALREVARC